MLKITRETNHQFGTLLRLEGKLTGPWVETLAVLCAPIELTRIALDLSHLHYVDQDGCRLLTKMIEQGVQVVAASGFIKELLHLEKR